MEINGWDWVGLIGTHSCLHNLQVQICPAGLREHALHNKLLLCELLLEGSVELLECVHVEVQHLGLREV